MPGVNLRLMCGHCGEMGQMAEDEGDFFVSCDRNGKLCCKSFVKPTEEEAVVSWERMWPDGEAA